MEKANLNFVRFEAADVITTSGPFAKEDINDATLYYFYGLGNDRQAPGGAGLLIRNQGVDVTDQYLNTLYDESQYYAIRTGFTPLAVTSDGVEGQSSAYLEGIHIYDGAYTLSDRKFSYKQ